ncbi:MAG: hypothetical protein INQ03_00600 [Candidatus Heimdallarchaeota archaeon]|nr:hypothetical protein [Candidatus Heimdallarchaeota archaeon]
MEFIELIIKTRALPSDPIGYWGVIILNLLFLGITIRYYLKFKLLYITFEQFQQSLHYVYRIQFWLVVRFVISFITYTVWVISNGEFLLRDIYLDIVWIIIVYYTFMLMRSEKLVSLNTITRGKQRSFLLFSILFTILLISVMIIVSFTGSLYDNILAFLLTSIAFMILSTLLYNEYKQIKKGVNRLRLVIMTIIMNLTGIYIFSMAVFFIYIPSLLSFMPGWYAIFSVIITNGLVCFYNVVFYWLIDPPKYIKKRYITS